LVQNSSEERDLIGGSKKERFKSSFGREENSKEIKKVGQLVPKCENGEK
jgi:hypothetical protein